MPAKKLLTTKGLIIRGIYSSPRLLVFVTSCGRSSAGSEREGFFLAF